jgi:hypothetical protein
MAVFSIRTIVFFPQVVVKTVSGSVASWPATGNVTTRPLPVMENIQTVIDEETKEAAVVWEPHPDSYQDEYKVRHVPRFLNLQLLKTKPVPEQHLHIESI